MNTQKKVSKGSKSKTRNTRSSTKINFCGLPSLLPLNTLPTKKETISFFELTKEEKIGSGNLTKKLRPSLLTKVADSVFEIWKRACVPTISKCNIVKMIDRLVSKYYKVKHKYITSTRVAIVPNLQSFVAILIVYLISFSVVVI